MVLFLNMSHCTVDTKCSDGIRLFFSLLMEWKTFVSLSPQPGLYFPTCVFCPGKVTTGHVMNFNWNLN